MCGFAGLLNSRQQSNNLDQIVEHMTNAIRHRGPDDSGIWSDSTAGIALGHRRLSIQDLSPAGHQPMCSSSGRYIIAFNGEIYNHLSLRKSLCSDVSNNSFSWRGHSDTETLLACIDIWGVEKTLKNAVGMFAFALWDREKRRLILARDRFGEKPLYYGISNGNLIFASELKAIRQFPEFSGEIDRGALALFMRYSEVAGSHCIYSGFSKLVPGTWLSVSAKEVESGQLPEPEVYWSAYEQALSGVTSPLDFSSDIEAMDELERLLMQSISGQMLSDVPLGAFLSGGFDSSTVAALMQVQSSIPIKTFSIGFHEEAYNEAQHAKMVAEHLGTNHHELYVTSGDALAVIPKLSSIYDEPFADSSQIPTFLVMQMTQQHVTVGLSGDGGDELFAGYNRYFMVASILKKINWMPLALQQLVASIITTFSPSAWNRVFAVLNPMLPSRMRFSLPGDKLHKGTLLFGNHGGAELYRQLVSHWDPADIVLDAKEPPTLLDGEWPKLPSLIEQMMLQDAVTYLPDDILTKVDRAAMAVSLETRVPMLDHRVFEFAWRLPLDMKIRNGQGKWLLRQVLYRHIPKELVDRPKMGFGVPIDSWLRGPLREWAEELLDESRLRREGYFNPSPIRKKWKEHLSGQRNWQYLLWNVLMFQSWIETQHV